MPKYIIVSYQRFMIMLFWRLSKFLMCMCFPFFVSSFNVWVFYFSRLNFMIKIHPKIDALFIIIWYAIISSQVISRICPQQDALDLMEFFSLSWFHTTMIKLIDKHHISYLYFPDNSTSHKYFILALKIWIHA